MLKQINEWKQQEVQNFVEGVTAAKETIKSLKEKYGRKYCCLEEYKNIPTAYRELFFAPTASVEQAANEYAEAHLTKLQAKVEKKIGAITEIQVTGNNGHEYYFIGETGACEIRVIAAGGYNIQRRHTRWIII